AAVPGFGVGHVYPLHPDLDEARRLAGSTRHQAILTYCTNGPFAATAAAPVAALIRAELDRIGIVVSIVTPPCAPDNRYHAYDRRAELILVSGFSPVLDPQAFLSLILSTGSRGAALGGGLWSDPGFLASFGRAQALRGSARRAAYRRLEDELLRA